MQFNAERYLHCMEGVDVPLSQKIEILKTVWMLMEAQVDKAFGLHPVQCISNVKKTSLHEASLCLESIKTDTVPSFNGAASNDERYERKVYKNG